MQPEDHLLFACTRQEFNDQHERTVRELIGQFPIRWGHVWEAADKHDVTPVVYQNLKQLKNPEIGIPPDIMSKLQFSTYRSSIVREKRAVNLEKLLEFFHNQNIDVMLYKGAALDLLVYRDSTYTVSQDLDIILRPRREELSSEEFSEIQEHLHRTGIECDCFEHHDMNLNRLLPIDFERIWKDAHKNRFRSQEVYLMSIEDLLIALCINSIRKRFFRLKSLCDIAETIHRYRTELKWEELALKARAYECSNIVYAALLVTYRTLGYPSPDLVLKKLRVSFARRAAIDLSVRYLLQRLSLVPYPFPGIVIFGRPLHLSLMLSYATYTPGQLFRKATYVYRTRKLASMRK